MNTLHAFELKSHPVINYRSIRYHTGHLTVFSQSAGINYNKYSIRIDGVHLRGAASCHGRREAWAPGRMWTVKVLFRNVPTLLNMDSILQNIIKLWYISPKYSRFIIPTSFKKMCARTDLIILNCALVEILLIRELYCWHIMNTWAETTIERLQRDSLYCPLQCNWSKTITKENFNKLRKHI